MQAEGTKMACLSACLLRCYQTRAHFKSGVHGARQAHEQELDAEQLEAFVRERFGNRDSAALVEGGDDGAPAGASWSRAVLRCCLQICDKE